MIYNNSTLSVFVCYLADQLADVPSEDGETWMRMIYNNSTLSVFVCYLTGRLAEVPGEDGETWMRMINK